MKNLLVVLTVILFASIACNDEYLEKFPLTSISDEVFWQSGSDVIMYANQFYQHITHGNQYSSGPHFWRVDNGSDDLGPSSGPRPAYHWGETPVPTSGGGWSKGDWLQIRRTNYAMARIKDMEKTAIVLQGEGEIRFFRAFFYFEKLRRFGDVPWIDRDLSIDSEELFKGRDDRKFVAGKIIEDLDFAIQHLPETSADLRLTKYAAAAFKAEMLLFEGTWRKYHGLGDWEPMLRESVNAAEIVINSGMFNVYSTGNPYDDYFDLFVQYDLRDNPEAIMYTAYRSGLVMHDIIRQLGEQMSGWTKNFIESYLCTDGLPIALSDLYMGDATVVDEFVNRDPRMWQMVYHPDRVYRIYPDGSLAYRPVPTFDANYNWTGYWIIKMYSPYELDRVQGTSTTDQFIFRYGRLLVNYAEAKAELGEATQQVLDISINKLRDRVAMPHLTVDVGFTDPNWPDWEVPPYPNPDLINEIRRERRIETAVEANRWFDLMRWNAGKLLEHPLVSRGARDPATGELRDIHPGLTRVWYDRLYLQPIPRQELSLNPALVQNPGWEGL